MQNKKTSPSKTKYKNQANSGESYKPYLISKIYNQWNPGSKFNQEV
jgi:hypothetical protein